MPRYQWPGDRDPNRRDRARFRHQYLFERFYRADSTNTAIRGVGLGLTIVRQVVESHNGRIRIESLAGEGTTVTVTLPLVQTQVSDSYKSVAVS